MKLLLKFPMFLKQKKMDICLEFYALGKKVLFENGHVTLNTWSIDP